MDAQENSHDESDTEHAPGSGVGAPPPPNVVSNGILQAIQALNIQAYQPASKLASGIALTNQDFEQKQKALLLATRKHKMEAFVKTLQNPMSARAVRH